MTPLRDPNPEHRLRVERARRGRTSVVDARVTARKILSVCGAGRLLVIGDESGRLLRQLLGEGVDAHGCSAHGWPEKLAKHMAAERLHECSLTRLPFDDGAFETIAAIHVEDDLKAEEIGAAVLELRRVARRFVFAQFTNPAERPEGRGANARRREEWQALFFEAGFRQHPLSQWATDYNELEKEGGLITLIFERIPEAALKAWPLEKLKDERDLHMDMLREPGRRADAHVARYILAARLVRPGDVVLDAACGLGYGSAVLASGAPSVRVIGVDNSEYAVHYARDHYSATYPLAEFRQADVNRLEFLADASVDLVACFETLEHVADGKKLLSEFRRVLRPAGRIVLSIPNQWVDETGKDPNPHHLTVYDWGSIHRRVAHHLLPERAWSQIAGGSMKLSDRPRSLTEVPIAERQKVDAEWWLIAAMKDPVRTGSVPYVENNYPDYHTLKKANITAFGRDYDNPWLMRAMVSMGMRAENPDVLSSLARRTVLQSRAGSPDRGAALCVLAYRWLEGPARDTPQVEALLQSIKEYHKQADDSPHAWRWRISCQYVAARILLALGRRAEARKAFLACAAMDCLKFSPLLATKTVDALWQAGMIAVADGMVDDARECWTQAIQETRRVLAGDWTNIWGRPQKPAPFGLAEVAEIADLASRCAYALHAMDHAQARPGYAWRRATQNKREELAFWRELAQRRQTWIHSLEEAKSWLEAQRAELLNQIQQQTSGAAELLEGNEWLKEQVSNWTELAESRLKGMAEREREIARLTEAVEWHAQQLRQHELELAGQQKLIEEKHAWGTQLEEGKVWLETQVGTLQETVREREERIKSIEQWNLKLAEGNKWLASEIEAMQETTAVLQQANKDLKAWVEEVEQGKAWLESEKARLETELGERDAKIGEFIEWNRALEEGLRWLEQQRITLQTTVAEREDTARALETWTSTLDEGRKWLETERSRFEASVIEQESVIRELREWNAKLEEGNQWAANERARLSATLEERDATVLELRVWIAELEKGKQWLEEERARLGAALADRDAEGRELREWNAALEEGKQWLEQERARLGAALEERDAEARELREWNAALEEGKQWLEEERERLQLTVEEREQTIAELRAWNENVGEGKQWLEAQRAELQTGLAEREATIQESLAWNKKLEEAKAWLSGRVEELEHALRDETEAGASAKRDGESAIAKSREECAELEVRVAQMRAELDSASTELRRRETDFQEVAAKLEEERVRTADLQRAKGELETRAAELEKERTRLRGKSVWQFFRSKKR